MLTLLIVVIVAALLFDFINGFHDAANAIATTVATGAMSLGAAVVMSGLFNFFGALSGEAVAKTIAKGFVENPHAISQVVVLSALVGASIWNLLTWWWGLPSSSSHALIGGLGGAVIISGSLAGWAAHGDVAMLERAWLALKDGGALFNWGTLWNKIIIWLALSPLIGFSVAFAAMIGLTWLCRHWRPNQVNRQARMWQLVTACTFSWTHGLNDAQKVMGIITLALLGYVGAHGAEAATLPTWFLPDEKGGVPLWVKVSCAMAIGLGTMAGGKRIIKTMGTKVARILPLQGFAAQTSGTITLLITGKMGIPVSTTHAINAAILGAGSAWRLSAVRWGVVGHILLAWIITLPASAVMAAVTFLVLNGVFGGA